jgi:transcriptional accessory protein Tex/SPT6
MRAFSFPLRQKSMPLPLIKRLAGAVAITGMQAQAAVDLLDSGATVPFIARYRKEATGNLDDTQCACSTNAWLICENSKRAARL